MPDCTLQGVGGVSDDDSDERVIAARPSTTPTRTLIQAGQVGTFPDAETGRVASDHVVSEDGFGHEEHAGPSHPGLLDAVLTEAGCTRQVTVKDISGIPSAFYENNVWRMPILMENTFLQY